MASNSSNAGFASNLLQRLMLSAQLDVLKLYLKNTWLSLHIRLAEKIVGKS